MSLKVVEILDNYLKYQENIKSASPLTLKAYRMDLNQAFENKLDLVCSYEDLWGFVRPTLGRWGNLSLASRNRKIATLKSLFGWLYDQKHLDNDFSSQLICPKVPKKIPHFLSVDEVISIIDSLNRGLELAADEPEKLAKLKRKKALFLLLYGGGLRISEACKIKWSDIQFKEKRILILGKGSKERYAALPAFSMDFLKELHSQKNKEDIYVFGTKALHTRIGYGYIRELGSSAGLMASIHPHSLRHSYATHMLASGANLRTLQTLLGHESLQATEKYTHLSVDHLARLVEQTHPLKKLKLTS
ncbi:tyrosine-type recombinase/integrase [bacterium]|nr:tyrosine-type recombinase/integrase [bacterium]